MALQKLDTEHFSDAEKSAQHIADKVADIKALMQTCTTCACYNWIGKGRQSFNSLHNVVRMQMQDISDEFYELAEALINAESAYLEGDQEIGTNIRSSAEN